MIPSYQVTAFISAFAVLLARAAPQNAATSTSTPTTTATTVPAQTSTGLEHGISLCPVTDGPFPLKFLGCTDPQAFDSCSCETNGLPYQIFFSCAFEYVKERTARATTDQAKQDIKAQVKGVVDQYVQGCKNAAMPIQSLDVTSGVPPNLPGGSFSFSTSVDLRTVTTSSTSTNTATQSGVNVTSSSSGVNVTLVPPTSSANTATKVGVGAAPTSTQTGNASRARHDGVGLAAVLALLMLVIH